MAYRAHIFELHSKPSMAIQTRWLPNREPFFKIFTLVDTDKVEAYKYKWAEVVNFDEHALFLGPNWSKAVHVAVGQHHGLKRNHIYYGAQILWGTNELPDDIVYSMKIDDDEHMYCKKDQSVGDSVERTGYHLGGFINSHMWLYPPNL